MTYNEIIDRLDSDNYSERIRALTEIKALIDENKITPNSVKPYVNDHIHTKYSFSPYTPSSAVFHAWQAGLETCGIMDHETTAGCKEFIEAGRILEIPVTCGLECRVKMTGTALEGKRINHQYQSSIAYFVMHGIPHQMIDKVDEVFKPLREKRKERIEKICDNLNSIIADNRLEISFKEDVLPLSMYSCGGTVTERHICQAIAKKILSVTKEAKDVLYIFNQVLKLQLSKKSENKIYELDKKELEYFVIDIIKRADMLGAYIDADEECLHITELVDLCESVGAICAYAYLGDVEDNITSNKIGTKAYEDSYLELLAEELKRLNVSALTYMPFRNTRKQSENILALCDKYSFFQISGEDINSYNQPFVTDLMLDPMFSHLKDSTYAIIGNEILATNNIENAMFSKKTRNTIKDLNQRISYYAEIAKKGE